MLQNSWIVEMSEGLNEPKQNEADSDGEFKSINPPVMNKKKSKQQRRKQKEQRALLEARLRAKIEKKKIADIYKLRIFEKEIATSKKKTELLKEKREKLKKLKLLQPKRIGGQKFEASDLDFNKGEDIAGNLRNLKSEGNLLKDRFKSLQKRNILEPSTKQPGKKRAKVKKYEKPSHKMGWESKKGQKAR